MAKEFPTAPTDSFVVANAGYVARETSSDAVGTFLVQTDGSGARAVAGRVRRLVSPDAKVTDIQDSRRVVGSNLTAVELSGLTRVELAFALVLAAAASGLALGLGFRERRRTYAIAVALGARRRQLGGFVWGESAFVTAGGLGLGAVVAAGISLMLVKVLTGVFDPPPAAPAVPWAYLAAVVALTLAAAGAAGAVSLRALRRPAIEELRDLWVSSWLHGPAPPCPAMTKVSVLVPVFEPGPLIEPLIASLLSQTMPAGERELVFVDDGSRDGTGEVARAHGAVVARHVINRGGGAALRTGYRLMVDSGAEIVVTLDADGQHLPSEMERLVKPVLDGEVDMAHGSRVLGQADRNHFARELGIVFFNRLVSLITRTHVTDCSNGYRAVRTTVLPQLVLRQEQFHTSEFMIEAIKRGIPAKEIPITVEQRLHGHSKKPAVVRYGLGFANAIVRTWLR